MRISYQQFRQDKFQLTAFLVGLSLLFIYLFLKERQLSLLVEDIDGILLSHVLATARHPSKSPTISMTDTILSTTTEFLERFRTKQGMKILNIAYDSLDSNQIWQQYFPRDDIFFVDNGSGAQSKPSGIHELLQSKGLQNNLDFIIDVGVHDPDHHHLAYLFEHGLKPGGVYIYEHFGHDNHHAVAFRLKDLVDVVYGRSHPHSQPYNSSFGRAVDDTVQSIFFSPHAVVMLKMATNESALYSPDTYKWKDRTKKTE